VTAADAVRALAKVPATLLEQLGPIPPVALQALADWLDGADGEPVALDSLPDTLKSELALARAEARAKAGGG
jgi:hypothetical protein